MVQLEKLSQGYAHHVFPVMNFAASFHPDPGAPVKRHTRHTTEMIQTMPFPLKFEEYVPTIARFKREYLFFQKASKDISTSMLNFPGCIVSIHDIGMSQNKGAQKISKNMQIFEFSIKMNHCLG